MLWVHFQSVGAEMQLKGNLTPLTRGLGWLRVCSWQILNLQCLWSNVCCWELTLRDYWCNPNFLCLLCTRKGQWSKWGVDILFWQVLSVLVRFYDVWGKRSDWQAHRVLGNVLWYLFFPNEMTYLRHLFKCHFHFIFLQRKWLNFSLFLDPECNFVHWFWQVLSYC